MPDFTIRGNPGNIRSKAVLMDQKGQLFFDTGEALSKIDTSGWTGRAADTFRDAHDLEPERWIKAGNGFKKASAALTTYAGALESAQSVADWAREEHARGDRESERARTQYAAYMDRVRAYQASGGTMDVEPFHDSGEEIRQRAISGFNTAKADLDSAAHTCAGEVRAGCADAPEEPNWFESGLRFVGGVLEGAGEAVWDLLTMVPFSPVNMVMDHYKLATGELTPEELAKKYELSVETAVDIAQGMYTGITTDPIGFGKELGKSLLDWDTWADDPARAIGHLVPDAIAAAATAGVGAVATRGAKGGIDIVDGMSDMSKMDNLDNLDELDDLGRMDGLDDLDNLDDVDGVPGAGRADDIDYGDTPGFNPDGTVNPEHFRTDPDSAFFWSGRTDGVGGAEVAGRYAQEANGTTLEQLMEQRGVKMPEWDADDPDVVRTWGDASAAYAQQASGEVRAVVGQELRPGNVWETRELDSLKENPHVTRIIRVDPKTGETEVLWER